MLAMQSLAAREATVPLKNLKYESHSFILHLFQLIVLLAIHLVSGYGAPWWEYAILEKAHLGHLDTLDYHKGATFLFTILHTT